MIQRVVGDQLYSVERDVAHNFGWVAQEMMKRMNDRHWKEIEEILRHHGVSDEEVGKALESFATFIMSAKADERAMQDALGDAGWWECNPYAKVAVAAYLGNVLMGVYHVGVKEATAGGMPSPILRYPNLQAQAAEMKNFYHKTPWHRLILCAFKSLFKRK